LGWNSPLLFSRSKILRHDLTALIEGEQFILKISQVAFYKKLRVFIYLHFCGRVGANISLLFSKKESEAQSRVGFGQCRPGLWKPVI
jgi:hypothetical protein